MSLFAVQSTVLCLASTEFALVKVYFTLLFSGPLAAGFVLFPHSKIPGGLVSLGKMNESTPGGSRCLFVDHGALNEQTHFPV